MTTIIKLNVMLILIIASVAFSNIECDLVFADTLALNAIDFTGYTGTACVTDFGADSNGEAILYDENLQTSGYALLFVNGTEQSYVQYKSGPLLFLGPLCNGEEVDYDDNGNIKRRRQWHNDTLDGEYTKYYENGNKQTEGNYKNGKAIGEWTGYRMNGTDSIKETYNNGIITNRAIYYENGNKLAEWNYKNGKADGPAYIYYENGQIWGISTYKNDNLEGKFTEYFSNGKVAGTAMYKNGKRVGLKHCTDGRIGSDDLDCTD